MTRRRGRTIATWAAGLALLAAGTTTATSAGADEADVPGDPGQCQDRPQYFGYARAWGDPAAGSGGGVQNPLDDVPHGVDIVFAFGAPTPGTGPLWETMDHQYVANLHAQGTKVVLTHHVEKLIDPAYSNTPAGYEALAQRLVADLDAHDLDGLDFDIERSLSATDLQRVGGVFAALSKYVGPKSGTDRLLILDTNQSGTHPMVPLVAPFVSYVLKQTYSGNAAAQQAGWEAFAPYIHPCQYFIGFSFYEQRGARWGAVTAPIETSGAYKYALWQPAGGTKGGIFSYAIERDGKVEGDDTSELTDYTWSKTLVQAMNDAAGYVAPAPSVPAAQLSKDRKTVSGSGINKATVRVTVSAPGRSGTTGAGHRVPATYTTTVAKDGTWSVDVARVVPSQEVTVTQQWWNTAESEALTLTHRR